MKFSEILNLISGDTQICLHVKKHGIDFNAEHCKSFFLEKDKSEVLDLSVRMIRVCDDLFHVYTD